MTSQNAVVIDQFQTDEFLGSSCDRAVCSVDWEALQSEDKLGCARGIVWAIIFEAGAVVAAMAFWKLHFLAH
ncbi:MAG TPA: hypothetical protein VMB49_04760 [Acidobacteriaceae bacterium]|nr:hypothetical protein [Acidobacteriaceae bacterium]